MFTIEKAEYNSVRGVFSRAKFIVVGTHGTNGLIALDDSLLTGPTALPDNDNLRFIYFGPCEFGKKTWRLESQVSSCIDHGLRRTYRTPSMAGST